MFEIDTIETVKKRYKKKYKIYLSVKMLPEDEANMNIILKCIWNISLADETDKKIYLII